MRAIAHALLLALLVLLAAQVAIADDAVPLALKFAQGDVLNYAISISGAGQLSVAGSESTGIAVQGSCTFSQTAVQVNEDGSAVLETLMPQADFTVTIKNQQARFSYADGKLRWFTDGKEQTPPQADLSKAPLLQSPLRVTTKPDGSVTDIAFSDTELLEMLRKAVPGLDKAMLGPGMPAVSSAPVLPASPVKVGETWTRTHQVPLGPNQRLDCEMRRALESVTKQGGLEIAKIVGSGEARFRGNPKLAAPGGQPVDVSIADLRQTFGSTEFFNLTTGRLIRGDYDIRFNTKLAVAMAGQGQTGSLDLRILASVVAR